MLINKITDFCKDEYESFSNVNRCENCSHRYVCPKELNTDCTNCKACLEEIHYHKDYGKTDYDCYNMINFYVCCYSFKYASELYCLSYQSDLLKKFENYNVLSFGCGPCPDLMALENYNKPINYFGIDKNTLWENVHNEITKYTERTNISVDFGYEDALEYIQRNTLDDKNIIVLQYFISHLYNTNQIDEINKFYDNLINNVIIPSLNNNNSVVIMINDVNSNNCGRDHFWELYNKLREKNLGCNCKGFYFDSESINDYQRYGSPYDDDSLCFDVPNRFDGYPVWKRCTSAQLLIEIERG